MGEAVIAPASGVRCPIQQRVERARHEAGKIYEVEAVYGPLQSLLDCARQEATLGRYHGPNAGQIANELRDLKALAHLVDERITALGGAA